MWPYLPYNASSAPLDNDEGTVYLQYVDYTFNPSAGSDSKCRVDFTYARRPDAKATFQLGQQFINYNRLVAIEATHDGQVVRHYDLECQQAALSGVSQLVRVTERGIKPANAGDPWPSFPPTVFEWDQNSAPNHVYSDTAAGARRRGRPEQTGLK